MALHSQYSKHVSTNMLSATVCFVPFPLLVWFSMVICAAPKCLGDTMIRLTTIRVVKLWRALYMIRKHELIHSWLTGRTILNSVRLDSSITQP